MSQTEIEVLPSRTKTQYSDAFKAQAILSFQSANDSLQNVARSLDIPWQTLQDWVNGEGINDAVREIQQGVKGQLADEFETSVRLFLERAQDPDAIAKTSAYYAIMGAKSAAETMQLLRGLPTSITENHNVESRQVLALLIQAIAPMAPGHNDITLVEAPDNPSTLSE